MFPNWNRRYGSIFNPNVKYAIPPTSNPHSGHTDHEDFPLHDMIAQNEFDGAMEDFTSYEARIFPPISAKLFAETALVSDPIKVQWWNLHQLNECRPSLVKVPTMVVSLVNAWICSQLVRIFLLTLIYCCHKYIDCWRSRSILTNADAS